MVYLLAPMFEITKAFQFDAAHFLPHAAPGHPNARVHGHSFTVEVTLQGVPDPKTGLIVDFATIEAELAQLREGLDHHFLNEIEDLGAPTLENLARYIFERLSRRLNGLTRVTVRRPSCREACTYQPASRG